MEDKASYYYTEYSLHEESFNLSNSSLVEFYYVGNDEAAGAGLWPVSGGYNYVEPSLLVLICLVGLLGNGLVVVVIVRQVSMRRVTYLYLSNLALVNLLYLLTTLPFSAISYTLTHWPFGTTACKLHGYVSSVCLSASVFTLTATGLDRYLAVLHPVTSRRWRTERKAVAVIVLIWALSFVLMAPRLLLYHVQEFFDTEPYVLCSRLTALLTARRADSAAMLVTMYVLPQLVLCFCHLKIGLLLWRGRRPGPGGREVVGVLALRERRRVAKIVLAVTAAFAVGWLPMHVTNVYEDFSHSGASFMFENRAILVLAFSFSANAVNPVLYCLLSRHFRKHFRRAVLCCAAPPAPALHPVTPLPVPTRRHDDIVVIDLENQYHPDKDGSRPCDAVCLPGDPGDPGDADTSGSANTGGAGRAGGERGEGGGWVGEGRGASCYLHASPARPGTGHRSRQQEQGPGFKPRVKRATVVATTTLSSPVPRFV